MTEKDNPSGRALRDFLAESEEIINQLSMELVSLGDCVEKGECDPDVVNSIFRGAHSLKGLAGMLGLSDIADLAHNLESLLDLLRMGKIPITQSVVNVLFDSMELLGALVRAAGTEEPEPPGIASTVERINDCISIAEKNLNASPLQCLGLPQNLLNALTEYEEHRLLENIKKGRSIFSVSVSYSLATFDRELGELIDTLKKSGEVISTLPSAEGNMENSISFMILFGSEMDISGFDPLKGENGFSVARLGSPPGMGLPAVQNSLPVDNSTGAPSGIVSTFEEQVMTARSVSRTMRVDIGKLDELMNIVGELILSHSQVADISVRLRNQGFSGIGVELGKAAKGLERKLGELQKGVMEIRMTPLGQLFEKMSRIVRKISREQGKLIDLRIFGAETELDRMIIEDISDPLMHIIRNSIDHGIETPEDRLRCGKDEKGTISLVSCQKGNHVVIEVRDDGRGIDVEKVKRKAMEAGHLRDGDGISAKDALNLLFLPGLSTADQVSEISGRGVGMDVVRNNIEALSGMVDIESERGLGTCVTITLPITLAIIKALLITAAGRSYAVPITSVQETLFLEKDQVVTVERKEVMQLRDITLPLLRLSRFFGTECGGPAPECCYVIVVGLAEKRVGIVVDDLIGQQDIVIKPLGETLKGIRGISGAADLGDQRTILVLDVGGIISEATRSGV